MPKTSTVSKLLMLHDLCYISLILLQCMLANDVFALLIIVSTLWQLSTLSVSKMAAILVFARHTRIATLLIRRFSFPHFGLLFFYSAYFGLKIIVERANVAYLPCPILFPMLWGNKICLNQNYQPSRTNSHFKLHTLIKLHPLILSSQLQFCIDLHRFCIDTSNWYYFGNLP